MAKKQKKAKTPGKKAKKPPGRPRKTGDERVILSARVPVGLGDLVDAAAAKAGLSRTDWLELAIRNELMRHAMTGGAQCPTG